MEARALVAVNQTAYQTAAGSAFLARGGIDYAVVLHQLGNAVGLAQPHDTSGTAAVFPGVTSA